MATEGVTTATSYTLLRLYHDVDSRVVRIITTYN